MRNLIHFVPVFTSIIAFVFAGVLYQRWRSKPSSLYLAWWTIGVVTYGVGTLTESMTTLFGWHLWIFRA